VEGPGAEDEGEAWAEVEVEKRGRCADGGSSVRRTAAAAG